MQDYTFGNYDFSQCFKMFGSLPKTATIPVDSVQLRNIAKFAQLTRELPPVDAYSADGSQISFMWQFICMMAAGYQSKPQNPLAVRMIKPVTS